TEVYESDWVKHVFGEGKLFSENGYYKNTDIGFLRLWLFGGFFYLIVFFLPTASLLFFSLKNKIIQRLDKVLLVSLYLVLLICNLKGLVEISAIMLLVYFISFTREPDRP